MVESRKAAFGKESLLAAARQTLGRMIDVVRLEIASAVPFREAVSFSIILAARDGKLRVINYGLPIRPSNDAAFRKSAMPSPNISHRDYATIDAVTALLECKNPVPTIESPNACVFSSNAFNCRHLAERRLSGGTSHHTKEAKKWCHSRFHNHTSSHPSNVRNRARQFIRE